MTQTHTQIQTRNTPASSFVPRLAQGLLATRWLQPLHDRAALNGLLGSLNPLWSVDQVRAEVIEVLIETADTRSFVLRPNHLWRGFKAGQHVVLEVEIEGRRHQRVFSLSSAPSDGLLRLTVKRQPGGLVTGWLHERLRVGQVLGIGAAAGELVLPASLPGRILMLSAGSGITPLMAMLRDLHARDANTDVVFVHSCRSPQEQIFGAALRELAQAWPRLRLVEHYSATQGRLEAAGLQALVPDWQNYGYVGLCGPVGFNGMVESLWQSRGLQERLHSESFGAPLPPSAAEGTRAEVRCVRSEKLFAASGGPLLAEAEQAGLKPRYGCRIGICRSCQCVKRSGTVENLLTGEVSSVPGQTIQLCISAARSDLALEL